MSLHLTKDDIIDFILIDTLNEESLELAKRVNTHIMECSECFKLVNAFRTVQSEFELCEGVPNLEAFLAKRYAEESEEQYVEL